MQVVNLSDEVNKNSELYVYKKIGLLNEVHFIEGGFF